MTHSLRPISLGGERAQPLASYSIHWLKIVQLRNLPIGAAHGQDGSLTCRPHRGLGPRQPYPKTNFCRDGIRGPPRPRLAPRAPAPRAGVAAPAILARADLRGDPRRRRHPDARGRLRAARDAAARRPHPESWRGRRGLRTRAHSTDADRTRAPRHVAPVRALRDALLRAHGATTAPRADRGRAPPRPGASALGGDLDDAPPRALAAPRARAGGDVGGAGGPAARVRLGAPRD